MTLTRTLSVGLLAAASFAVAPVAQGEEIRFALEMYEGDNPEFNAVTAFKEYVENKSGGDLTVRIFPGNQLGSVRDTTEMVQQGTLHMTLPSDGAFAGFYAPIQAWSMPYLFPSAPVAWEVMSGEFGEWMLKDIREQTGIRALAFSQNGFRSFLNNNRLIQTPKDMEGMKIRTMESPVYMEMVSALGADPTPIAGSEATMAFQQGVVDGLESPPSVHLSGGAAEVAEYMTLNEHVFGLHIVVANDEWFTSLSPENQQIVADGARVLAAVENVEKTTGDWAAIDEIREMGVEVHISSPEEKSMFREAVYQPVREFILGQVGEDVLNRIEAAVKTAEASVYGQ